MPDDFGFTHADPVIDDATLIANGYRPVPEYPATDGKPAKPVYAGWNCWLPSVEFLARMRQRHRGAVNTGILTGEVVATDRDDEDPGRAAAILEVIEMELGASPVHRVASKGGAEFYRTTEPFPSIEVVGRARGETKIRTLFEIHGLAKKTKDGKPLHKKLTAFGLNKHGQPIRYVKAGPDGTIATLLNTPLPALPLVTREQAMRCAEVIRQTYEVLNFTDVEIKGTRNWSRDDLGQFRQGHGEAVPFEYLQRMCAALNPDNLARAERVDFVTGIRAVNCPDDPDGNSRADLMVKWRRGDLRNEKAASFHDSDKDGDEDGVAAHIRDTFYGREPEGAIGFGTAHHLARTRGAWTEPAPHPHGDPNETFDESLKREQREGDEQGEFEPVDIFQTVDDIAPELPPNILPAVLEEWARDEADRLGVKPDAFTVPMLVVCSHALSAAFQIQPTPDTEFTMRAILWGMVAGASGFGKSPVQDKAIAPLEDIEDELASEAKVAFAKFSQARRLWEALEKKHLDECKCGRGYNTHEDWVANNPLYAAGQPQAPSQPPQLVTTKTTTEAVRADLVTNMGRSILLHPGEIVKFVKSFDQYRGKQAHGIDRGFYLDARDGRRDKTRLKGSNDPTLPYVAVGVLGGVQPKKLNQIADELSEDGFLQRFLIGWLPSEIGEENERAPDEVALADYRKLIRRLVELKPVPWAGAGIGPVKLSSDALKVWGSFRRYRNKWFKRALGQNEAWAGHLKKWKGIFAELLLVMHAVEYAAHAKGPDQAALVLPQFVSGDTAERARLLAVNYLMPGAEKLFRGAVKDSEEWDLMRFIGSFILTRRLKGNPTKFLTPRDIYQARHTLRGLPGSDGAKHIQEACQQLEMADWLIPIEVRPGRGCIRWEVVEKVHERYIDRAKAEAARKEELAEVNTRWQQEQAEAKRRTIF